MNTDELVHTRTTSPNSGKGEKKYSLSIFVDNELLSVKVNVIEFTYILIICFYKTGNFPYYIYKPRVTLVKRVDV